jgi:hypothetical protein
MVRFKENKVIIEMVNIFDDPEIFVYFMSIELLDMMEKATLYGIEEMPYTIKLLKSLVQNETIAKKMQENLEHNFGIKKGKEVINGTI